MDRYDQITGDKLRFIDEILLTEVIEKDEIDVGLVKAIKGVREIAVDILHSDASVDVKIDVFRNALLAAQISEDPKKQEDYKLKILQAFYRGLLSETLNSTAPKRGPGRPRKNEQSKSAPTPILESQNETNEDHAVRVKGLRVFLTEINRLQPVKGYPIDVNYKENPDAFRYGVFLFAAAGDITKAEEFMDSDVWRDAAAKALMMVGVNQRTAKSFYAHATRSFRDKRKKPWHDGLEKIIEAAKEYKKLS